MREHELILNYAKTNPQEFAGYKNLDWDYIARQAKFHNVAALLYTNTKNLDIPKNVLKELENVYTYTAFHNMLYLEGLQNIIQVLQRENINFIVLKGPILAQHTYGNIGLRPFRDLDILIKKDDIDKAISVLASFGYQAENANFYKKYHFHLPLTKTGKMPVYLELHWELVDQFILNKIDMKEIWDNTKDNQLSCETNVLYLLLHIEKHAFFNKAIYNTASPRDWIFTSPCGNQLIWYTDLYEFIDKNHVDWGKLTRTAREWCIENITYYTFFILNKLYPIKQLEDMPQPKLSAVKKLFYTFALKRKYGFNIAHGMQLRPIRAIDLVNYLFPPRNIINKILRGKTAEYFITKGTDCALILGASSEVFPRRYKYYCGDDCIPVIMLYAFHFLRGLKNVAREFLGICIEKYGGKTNNHL